MAEVYLARRVHTVEAPPAAGRARPYAVKVLQRKWSLDPHLREMFRAEAQLTSGLSHQNLIRVFDEGEHAQVPYIAMEYVDGLSCATLLRTASKQGKHFPDSTALYIAHEVLKGLAHAHRAVDEQGCPLRIVHRDVSPGNILISRTGTIKLTDFGIARSARMQHHTDPGQVKGKFGYMSPEQVLGESEVDERSDIFSLGIVLAEMVMGRRLFVGKGEYETLTRMYEADLGELDRYAAHSPELLPVLRRALSRDPASRYQNAADFAAAIEAVARSLGHDLDDRSLMSFLHERGVLSAHSGTYSLALLEPDVKCAD